jgi:predicted nucleotidyltransferase
MTVAGFREISEHSLTIRLAEPTLPFKVASIPGICIMKLFAWSDRKYADTRDGKDIGFIIANYIELKWDILYKQYADIVDEPEFHTVSSGARILGREIFYLLQTNNHALQAITEILKLETNDPDNSRLAIAMMQGGIAGYVLAFESLEQLLRGIKDKL